MHSQAFVDCLTFVLLFCTIMMCACGQEKRFEYKYSFKAPFLTKDDGTIPFWSFGGHAIAGEDSIRITPSLKNKRGWVWTTSATTFDNWEIEVSLRVTGRGRLGGDGIAIWYTSEPRVDGPVYGSSDYWLGLGIFLDTYDNDQQHNNPAVLAIFNDGNLQYDHDGDGASQTLGTCMRDYRNKPNPVRVRISLYKRHLTISLTNGLSETDQFEPCFDTIELPSTLPARGYLGISAATGELADDQDIHSLITHSYIDPEVVATEKEPQKNVDTQASAKLTDEERRKFEKEFQAFLEKMKIAKNEFEKEHGPATTRPPSDTFETESDRSVRQILAMQSETITTLRQIKILVDKLTQTQPGSGTASSRGTEPGSVLHAALPELVRKNDLQTSQMALKVALTDLRNSVDEIHRKMAPASASNTHKEQVTETISKRIDGLSQDMTSAINMLRNEVQQQTQKSKQSQYDQPPCSCASSSFLMILFFAQIVVLVIFQVFQSKRQMQAKKFY